MSLIKQLQSQTYYDDPFPVLETLRLRGPVVSTSIPVIGKVWLTTTHKATSYVLKNACQFPVRKPDGKVVGLSWWMPKSLRRLTSNMLASDDPHHSRLRRIVDHAFHRSSILALDSAIERMSQAQFENAASSSGSFDLVAEYARPFPLQVICELLGLPEKDRIQFMQWASGITSVNGPISLLFALRRLKPMIAYIESQIARVRSSGEGTGLIHLLVNESNEQLNDDELVSMIFLLLMAGHETTTHLISGSVWALMKHPDQLELLRSGDVTISLTIEELLRFVSPVQTTKPRFVSQDMELDGVQLSKGDIIMPFIAAANMDPDVFETPSKLDLSRRANTHIEFGTGVHFCLGHQLARLEIQHALGTLLMSDELITLEDPYGQSEWNNRFGFRSLQQLRVRT
jgi:cytochrome P450 PksS